ncbi:MAG TPA: amidohydrolase [Verrucomicrobiae bacterium]|nr:amidohydrolase [Verrucomicrobiae bacterium]
MKAILALGIALAGLRVIAAPALSSGLKQAVMARVEAEYSSLFSIYTNLHAHPELSFMETNTAHLVAREFRKLGFSVTERVGRTGVVGVLTNGPGPTVLVRGDMDGLPIKEDTGLPYASTGLVKDVDGKEHPAMHGCAHDAHVTSLIGAARVLAGLKNKWSGTLVMVAQPAEEVGGGARAMLADHLYSRFPKPDYALALHVSSLLPAGMVGYGEGPFLASVDSVDILVRGVGGHGSAPHTTKDPIVIASQIVLALQTIVSRELKPGTAAALTVGTIHGGLKRNIIPDEVKLELTLRAFDEKVMAQLIESIRRICKGTAQAAGVPEDRLPVVTVTPESVPATVNDVFLTRRLTAAFKEWLGDSRVKLTPPAPGGEDFSEFGRTPEHVPICLWWVGATAWDRFSESERSGVPVPSNHSATFAPVPEPTLKTSVLSMTAAVLEMMGATRNGTSTPR